MLVESIPSHLGALEMTHSASCTIDQPIDVSISIQAAPTSSLPVRVDHDLDPGRPADQPTS